MIVLSIECSTTSGGVAIVQDGRLIGSVNFSTGTLYSQRLLPSLEWLMQRCGIEGSQVGGIGVSRGPGSFTGLRIGLSAAKALAYAWNVPVVGIGSMEALALRASSPLPGQAACVLTLMDARQGELFAGLFEVRSHISGENEVERLRAEHLPNVEALSQWIDAPAIFAGDAVLKFEQQLRAIFEERFIPASPLRILPSAEEVAWLAYGRISRGESDNLMMLEPEYLRRSYMQR